MHRFETSPGTHPGPEPAHPWAAPAGHAHPRGTTVLVLGILSVSVLTVLGPFAWVMARHALQEADAAPHPTTNRSSLMAGKVLGIVGTCLTAAWLLWLFFVVALVLTTPG